MCVPVCLCVCVYLQHGHLLPVAEQAEGVGVLLVEAGADLAASQGQRGHVALEVGAVLVQQQLVVFQTAPALPPAVIGQHVQIACQSRAPSQLGEVGADDDTSKLDVKLNMHNSGQCHSDSIQSKYKYIYLYNVY